MKSQILELRNKLDTNELSVKDLVYQTVDKIKSIDANLNSVLEVYTNDFLDLQIAHAEQLIKDGKKTNLTGIPIVVKDNICVDGQLTTAGSQMLRNYKATYDAGVITKLKEAGAIIVGRANMDEFAMGSSTENSSYTKTLNPLNNSKVPGGSSGGSAAIVASGAVTISLGSDTGGSIRQPASFTGVVGLKPTYGEVSRAGLIAMGSSLDCIGPFGTNVKDVEIVFDVIRGKDLKDATTVPENLKTRTTNKKVIGVPTKFINQDGVDKGVRENFEQTLESLKSKGYTIKEIDIPNIESALSVYYILMFAEVSSNLARFDGVRYGNSILGTSPNESMTLSRSEGLGREPIRRSLIGAYVLSSGYYDAFYYKALKLRDKLKQDFAKIFEDVDYIATPTSPVLAWSFGEKSDPLSMYLADIFTVPANIVGVPGISVPTGEATDGLKYGVQFLTSDWNESKLFTIGYDLE